MYQKIVPAVVQKYGITDYRVGEMQKGYRNESYKISLSDNSHINLIFFKPESKILDRINRADYVSRAAGEAGLPVRNRYDDRLMRVSSQRYAGLYTYLPGETVSWEAMTKKHIKLLGYAMGELHSALQGIVTPDRYTVTDEIIPIITNMKEYFTDSGVIEAMDSKLQIRLSANQFDDWKRVVCRMSEIPGQQMLHMDMVRGNVLYKKATNNDKWQIQDLALSGLIDFEKAAFGHPLFDLARTLAFLFVDSPKPIHKVLHYFLYSGYQKRGGQPMPDIRLLFLLIQLFLIHDFYKFLRHTPYESLGRNHHYNRTTELLKTYGMIK